MAVRMYPGSGRFVHPEMRRQHTQPSFPQYHPGLQRSISLPSPQHQLQTRFQRQDSTNSSAGGWTRYKYKGVVVDGIAVKVPGETQSHGSGRFAPGTNRPNPNYVRTVGSGRILPRAGVKSQRSVDEKVDSAVDEVTEAMNSCSTDTTQTSERPDPEGYEDVFEADEQDIVHEMPSSKPSASDHGFYLGPQSGVLGGGGRPKYQHQMSMPVKMDSMRKTSAPAMPYNGERSRATTDPVFSRQNSNSSKQTPAKFQRFLSMPAGYKVNGPFQRPEENQKGYAFYKVRLPTDLPSPFEALFDTPSATPCLILTLRGDFSRNINFENLPDDLLDEALELQRHLVDKYGLTWAKFYASAGSWSSKGWGLHLHLQCELEPYLALWNMYRPIDFEPRPTKNWISSDFEESLMRYEEFKGKNFQKYVKKEIKNIKSMPEDTPSLIESTFGVTVQNRQFVAGGNMLILHPNLPRIGFIQYDQLTDMGALQLLKDMRRFADRLGLMDNQHGCQFDLYWKGPRDPEFKDYHVRGYIAFQVDDYWRMLPESLRADWLEKVDVKVQDYVEVD